MPILMTPKTTREVTEQELEQLFREHYQMMYRTTSSILNNTADAEDVPQTIFVQFLRNGASRDLFKNSKAYLYRAAVNSSLNILRSRKRRALEGLEFTAGNADTDSAKDTHRRLAE